MGQKWYCVPCNGLSVADNPPAYLAGARAAGHWNSAGGKCCPHLGSTCGVDHGGKDLKPEDEVPASWTGN